MNMNILYHVYPQQLKFLKELSVEIHVSKKIKIRKLPKILLENHKQRRTFHFKKLAAKMASKHFKSTVFISVLAGSCETFIYQVRRNSDQKNFSQIKEYRTKSLHVR